MLAVLALVYALNVRAGDPRLENTFGFFTNLTSLLSGSVFLACGWIALSGRHAPSWLTTARAVATSCLIVVAVVYNGLVPGTGTAPPWVSVLLHAVFPAYAVLDWILVADRPRLPWRGIWWVLPYPLLWLAATLIRGITSGWVPYGFLMPERGPLAITLTSIGLLAALLTAAALVWWASRLQTGRATAPGSPRTQPQPREVQ